MENASQALLIAAGVLIGVLILSLGVYLFSVFGGHAANIQSEIDAREIAQFNERFLKYNGRTDLTVQDIITVRNYALESNKKVDSNYDQDSHIYRATGSNDYIDVFRDGIKIMRSAVTDEKMLNSSISGNPEDSKKYTCRVTISENTGKVFKISFTQIDE